jgi:DNA-binding XRE family transcriptional regulator
MARKLVELKKRMGTQRRRRAEARARELLSEALALDSLRRSLNLTQAEVAQALDVNQAAVSQMEKQEDMYVSTLRRLVAAMGGELELIARFPGREPVTIEQFK